MKFLFTSKADQIGIIIIGRHAFDWLWNGSLLEFITQPLQFLIGHYCVRSPFYLIQERWCYYCNDWLHKYPDPADSQPYVLWNLQTNVVFNIKLLKQGIQCVHIIKFFYIYLLIFIVGENYSLERDLPIIIEGNIC